MKFYVPQSGKPCGAGRRTRTPDLLITNQLLYRLSYTGISNRAWLLYTPLGNLSTLFSVFSKKTLLHRACATAPLLQRKLYKKCIDTVFTLRPDFTMVFSDNAFRDGQSKTIAPVSAARLINLIEAFKNFL